MYQMMQYRNARYVRQSKAETEAWNVAEERWNTEERRKKTRPTDKQTDRTTDRPTDSSNRIEGPVCCWRVSGVVGVVGAVDVSSCRVQNHAHHRGPHAALLREADEHRHRAQHRHHQPVRQAKGLCRHAFVCLFAFI